MRRDMVKSLIPICLALVLLCGCSLKVPEPLLVSFSGTYVGDLEDHGPIRLTLTKAERGYSGYGTLDGKPISISLRRKS